MARATNGYSEIHDIKADLHSLKSDIMALTQHLQEDGQDRIEKFGKQVKAAGTHEFRQVEKRLKVNPTRNVAIALLAGVALSQIFGRR